MQPSDPDDITRIVPSSAGPDAVTPEPAAASAPTPPPAPATVGTAPPITPASQDPAVVLAPAAPVVRATPPARRGRLRWAVALALVVLVIGASAVVAAILVGKSPNATVIGYVPDKTVMYAEARLDLPGDQRQAVGAFLSHFPGFADQAALDGKLDQVLDDLVHDASKGTQTYTTDIKPWFGGELAASVGPLPPASSISADPKSADAFRHLALASIKDAAGAQAWFDAAFKKAGITTTTESYGGATLTILTGGKTTSKAAFAILDGKVAVVGDEASVKAAVDTGGHSGFAGSAGPKAALDAADADHIGFVYAELRSLVQWSSDAAKAMPQASGMPSVDQLPASVVGLVPEWGASWLRVENDALVMDAVAPQVDGAPKPAAARTSPVVDHVPAGALVAIVANDYGATLKANLDRLASLPDAKGGLAGLDTALGLLGGTDGVLSWIGDTAIAVDVANATPEGGVIILPTDAAKAKQFLTSVKSLIALGGGQAGASVREESYAGTTITIVDVGNLAALVGGAVPGTGSTGSAGVPDKLEIAFAATDDVVILGSGPDFVKHVLDTTKATSLGASDRYQALAKRAGPASSSVFVDVAAARDAVEAAMAKADPAGVTKYKQDVQPFLAPFDAAFLAHSVQGDLTQGTVIITVK